LCFFTFIYFFHFFTVTAAATSHRSRHHRDIITCSLHSQRNSDITTGHG